MALAERDRQVGAKAPGDITRGEGENEDEDAVINIAARVQESATEVATRVRKVVNLIGQVRRQMIRGVKVPVKTVQDMVVALQAARIYPTEEWADLESRNLMVALDQLQRTDYWTTILATSPLAALLVEEIVYLSKALSVLAEEFKTCATVASTFMLQATRAVLYDQFRSFAATHNVAVTRDNFDQQYQAYCNKWWYGMVHIPLGKAVEDANKVKTENYTYDERPLDWNSDARFVATCYDPYTKRNTVFRKPGRAAGYPPGYFVTKETAERYVDEERYPGITPRPTAIQDSYFFPHAVDQEPPKDVQQIITKGVCGNEIPEMKSLERALMRVNAGINAYSNVK